MSDPFIAEIRMFAGNFAPRGWSFCSGQLLPIAQNTALFSLIGTTFGGDGRTSTGLPNLKSRLPMHAGNGPGLTPRPLGSSGGAASVQLTTAQLAQHSHSIGEVETVNPPSSAKPVGKLPSIPDDGSTPYGQPVAAGSPMAKGSMPSAGGGQPHTNLMPSQGINFIIALTGIYPSP